MTRKERRKRMKIQKWAKKTVATTCALALVLGLTGVEAKALDTSYLTGDETCSLNRVELIIGQEYEEMSLESEENETTAERIILDGSLEKNTYVVDADKTWKEFFDEITIVGAVGVADEACTSAYVGELQHDVEMYIPDISKAGRYSMIGFYYHEDGWFSNYSWKLSHGSDYDENAETQDLIFAYNQTASTAITWHLVRGYELTYNLNGGSFAKDAVVPTNFNVETEDTVLPQPVKEGYEFAGWVGTGLNDAIKELIIKKGSTGNRTYYATWVKKEEPKVVEKVVEKIVEVEKEDTTVYSKAVNVKAAKAFKYYKKSSAKSKVKAKGKKGAKIKATAISANGKFVKTKKGWVKVASLNAVSVKAKRNADVMMRSKAKKNAGKEVTLKKDEEVKLFAKSGNWYLCNKGGWIHGRNFK